MKKKIISCIVLICMLISLCSTAYAADISTNGLEEDVSDHIEQMVSQFYSDQLGHYAIGNAVAIYNADTACVYYIIPIFCNQECVGVVEVDVEGNVTLTNEVTLYSNIVELSSSAYLLYTSGGIVYAERPGEVVELYDSGYDILVKNDFTSLPYADKVALAEICLETAAYSLDVSAVVEETELTDAVAPKVSPLAEVPTLETEQCSITNFVRQGDYNICWAACVATIANYKKGLSLTAGNVATAMGHNYTAGNYLGASLDDTVSALLRYGLTYSCVSGKPSWVNVKSNIVNNRPFIVCIQSTAAQSGHVLTGYGYGCQYGDAEANASLRYVQVWDPNGSKMAFTYHASSYTLGGYTWTWTHTLVD